MATWVTMTDAARDLRVQVSKISRLATKQKIATKEDPTDERVTLVDLEELREIFNVRTRRQDSNQ